MLACGVRCGSAVSVTGWPAWPPGPAGPPTSTRSKPGSTTPHKAWTRSCCEPSTIYAPSPGPPHQQKRAPKADTARPRSPDVATGPRHECTWNVVQPGDGSVAQVNGDGDAALLVTVSDRMSRAVGSVELERHEATFAHEVAPPCLGFGELDTDRDDVGRTPVGDRRAEDASRALP